MAGKLTVALRAAAVVLPVALLAASAGNSWGTGTSSCKGYVVNVDDQTLTVVDLDTMTELGSPIDLFGIPGGIAASPSGDRVWVSLEDFSLPGAIGVAGTSTNRVAVIDTDTDTIIADPDVAGTPSGVAAIPDGSGAYVACGDLFETWRVDSLDDLADFVYSEGSSGVFAVAAAVSPDSGTLALVDRVFDQVRFVDTSTHNAVGGMHGLSGNVNPRSAAFSGDGTKLVVAGEGAIDILDTSSGAVLQTYPVSFHEFHQVVVRGNIAFVTQEEEGDGGTLPGGIRRVDLTTNALLNFISFPAGRPTGLAVSPDGTTGWVTMRDGNELLEVDLVQMALTGRSVETGTGPTFIVAVASSAETPVPAYFLPKKMKLSLKGEGKDSLAAAGFFDDGGSEVDWDSEVTLTVDGFSETFELTGNATGTSFKFKGDRLSMAVTPNLKGSSRGKFKLKIAKTTLSELIDPEGDVGLAFEGDGLEECTGTVTLTNGAYALGKVRGALVAPAFFPAKGKASVGDGKPDVLSFSGGFATDGPLPEELGTVRFSFGPTFSVTVPGGSFTGSGGVFTHTLKQDGKTLSVKLDFLREKVTVKAKGHELGGLEGETVDVVLDAGGGVGAVRNTLRLGGTGAKRAY